MYSNCKKYIDFTVSLPYIHIFSERGINIEYDGAYFEVVKYKLHDLDPDLAKKLLNKIFLFIFQNCR